MVRGIDEVSMASLLRRPHAQHPLSTVPGGISPAARRDLAAVPM